MYRNGNYCAFYVEEPFNENNLGANSTRDFNTYNLLRAWKGKDSTFPFNDSHNKNYNVRDGSDWERTLKPRLHERINNSKNIILILSSITKNSRALKEEIDFGINTDGLPIIVIYPEFSNKTDIAENGKIKRQISNLWDKLPIFRDSMFKVPTLHVPMQQSLIREALENTDFMINSKTKADIYFYKA